MEETKKQISPALEAAYALSQCHTSLISGVVKLEEKRATLEEKMLKKHFIELAACVSEASVVLNQILSAEKVTVATENLVTANETANELKVMLSEFHKAFDYDWNYLEQYFEHGFYMDLTAGSNFLERMQEIPDKLKNESTH